MGRARSFDPDPRPRGPGLVYGALSLALLVLLTVFSLTALQPPPPSIAEFAPQAVEQIQDAPSEQTSRFGQDGRGPGGEGDPAGGAAGGTGSPPPPIDVPRVRKCVGDPPRQIEDPQSPPCVPYWEGDNGGSTTKGVTRDEIIVATDLWGEQFPLLQAFFNSRFEFYGRQIRLQHFQKTGNDRPEHMKADAVVVDEHVGAFAAINYSQWGSNNRDPSYFYDELARRKIIGVSGSPILVDDAHLSAKAPYQWSYLGSMDSIGRNLGEWMCATLAGRRAEFAGPALQGEPRAFGLISTVGRSGDKADVDALNAAMAGCDLSFAAKADIADDFPPPSQQVQTAMLSMQSKDVTTIVCMCHAYPMIYIQQGATNQSYFPEWIISSFGIADTDPSGHQRGDQARRTFGHSSWNKRVPTREAFHDQAVRQIDPTFEWDHDLEAQSYGVEGSYKALLLLASGIQLAGPNLTPETFQRGLFKATFPNPQAGQAPHYQAPVAFGPGDHTMNDDAAVVWWSASERSYIGPAGTYCYFELGRRYGIGTWRSGRQALFQPPCR